MHREKRGLETTDHVNASSAPALWSGSEAAMSSHAALRAGRHAGARACPGLRRGGAADVSWRDALGRAQRAGWAGNAGAGCTAGVAPSAASPVSAGVVARVFQVLIGKSRSSASAMLAGSSGSAWAVTCRT